MYENKDDLEVIVEKQEEELAKLLKTNRKTKIKLMEHVEEKNRNERRERTRRLIVRGGIVESILGVDVDENFLLGALLGVKKILDENDPVRINRYIENGKNYSALKKHSNDNLIF
jgi:polynucleotide 5'-kinase involved in rRNA processing